MWRRRPTGSYERGAADAADAAAAVVAVVVAARQVGRGHERVALVRTAVLGQSVHALLTAGLPGVGNGAIAVDVPRQQVHAVLETGRQTGSQGRREASTH